MAAARRGEIIGGTFTSRLHVGAAGWRRDSDCLFMMIVIYKVKTKSGKTGGAASNESQSRTDGGEPRAHPVGCRALVPREGRRGDWRCRHHAGGGPDPWRLLRPFRIQGRPGGRGLRADACPQGRVLAS